MADEGPKVSFTGDASQLRQTIEETKVMLMAVGAAVTDQNRQLRESAKLWRQAFSVPAGGGGVVQFMDTLGTKADQTKGKVSGLSRELQRLGTGAGLGLLAKETADMADVWTRSRNLLAATGVATGDLMARQSELTEMAIRTRTALEPTISLYSRMYRALTPLGAAERDIAKATETVNMAFKAGGAAVSEQNAAILQLSQSLGSGILQGDELRSVRENAPLIAKAIANEFGVSIAGLKKLGSEGKLTTERVFKGILDGGAAIEKQFSRTTATIGDSFNNLRTRLVEYIGGVDQATSASKLLGGVINLIASNIGLLIDAMIVAAAVMGANLARGAIAAVIVALKAMQAQLAVSAAMFQVTRGASVATSYAMAATTVAASGLRAALAALAGPVGIVIAIGTAIGLVADQSNKAQEATAAWEGSIDDMVASLETLEAKLDDIEEKRANRKVGDFGDINGQIESAAQRVDRLKQKADEISAKRFAEDIAKANTLVADIEGKIAKLRGPMELLERGGQKGSDAFFNLSAAVGLLEGKLREAVSLKERLMNVGSEGYDEASEKEYIQSVFDKYEFEEFAARNNSKKLIEILTQKVQTAKVLFGDESTEYMKAVSDKEKAEEALVRKAKESASEASRARKDAQKDALEALDTELEAAENNKEESIRIMQEKVNLLRKFYGEGSREYQRGLQEQIRMLRAFQNEENRVLVDGINLKKAIAEGEAAAQQQLGQNEANRKRALVQQALDQGRIDAVQAATFMGQIKAQELQDEISFETTRWEIARTAFQARLALMGLEPTEKAKILNDMVEQENAYNQRIKVLRDGASMSGLETQRNVANAVADSWKSILSPIGQSVNGMFQNLYNGTMGLKEAFLGVLDQMLFAFVDWAIQSGIQWAALELAKTSATVAGTTARTSAEVAAATTTEAVSGGAALFQILNYGWTAAAAAFSAVAGIPVIGPALAVGASAAALAAVLGFAGNILSAEGGMGSVPADGTITELHKQEMVLPAKFANPLRNMLTGSVGMPLTPGTVSATAGERADFFRQSNTSIKQGDTVLHYSPQTNVNNVSLQTLLRRDGLAMKKWMTNFQRNQPGGRPAQSA